MNFKKDFYLVSFATACIYGALTFMVYLSLYVKSVGQTETVAGLLFGSLLISYFIFTPITGLICDRFNSKFFMITGNLIFGISTLGFSFFDEWSSILYLFRLGQGIGSGIFMTAGFVYISKIIPDEVRGQYVGIYSAIIIVSNGAAAAIGEIIIKISNFSVFFISVSLITFIGAASTLLINTDAVDNSKNTLSENSSPFSFLSVYSQKELFTPMFAMFIVGIYYGLIANFFAVFATNNHLASAPFFVIYSIVIVLLRIYAMKYTDKYDRTLFVIPSFTLLTITFIIIASFSANFSFFLIILTGIMYGIGHGVLNPLLAAITMDRSAVEDREKALAGYNMAFMVGIHLFNGGFGWIIKNHGFSSFFSGLAAITAFGAIVYWFSEFYNKKAHKTGRRKYTRFYCAPNISVDLYPEPYFSINNSKLIGNIINYSNEGMCIKTDRNFCKSLQAKIDSDSSPIYLNIGKNEEEYQQIIKHIYNDQSNNLKKRMRIIWANSKKLCIGIQTPS